MTNVIAITRQFGSLGRYIAKSVAEKMGYEYYDRDIIEKMAERMGKDIKGLIEDDTKMKKSVYSKMIYPLGGGNFTKQEKLYDIEKEVILYLARKKNCVVVGRCADYILKEEDFCNVFSVYIYAPYNARYYFSLNNFGLTSDAVMDYIDKVDKARSLFYKRHTGEEFDSTKYRDMMIDSSMAGIDEIADIICYSARKKFKEEQ